jgi:hypothetical protein
MSSAHLSVATAIEKNRIASDKAFVLLMEIQVFDLFGAYVETLRLAKNSEDVTYHGQIYEKSNFSIKLNLDVASEPKLQCTAEDPAGVIRDRMELYSGGAGFPVRIVVVNTGNLDQPPEIEETFKVVSSSAAGYQVSFTMGIDNPIATRFPNRIQWRDQCSYRYKGARCKYSGSMSSCDFTRLGANGCKAHSNEVNFGGFLGLQNLQG